MSLFSCRWSVAYSRSNVKQTGSDDQGPHPHSPPMFDLVPVDGYGSALEHQPPLEDLGVCMCVGFDRCISVLPACVLCSETSSPLHSAGYFLSHSSSSSSFSSSSSGMNVLRLPSRHLAIDWHNNPKQEGHVNVSILDLTVSATYTLCTNTCLCV